MNKVTVCISPALYPLCPKRNYKPSLWIFSEPPRVCVLPSTTEPVRYELWQRWKKPYITKKKGHLVAAERNVKKCDFADFGNSPFDFTHEKVADKEIIFTTTNGTRAIEMALDADEILIGAFSNITTLTNHCNSKKNVLILCSGWNNRFCLEDTLFAGALTEKLIKTGKFCPIQMQHLLRLNFGKLLNRIY